MSVATLTPAPAFELQPYKSLENDVLAARIQAVRDEMGPRLLILGHHYQQDEVIALADLTGDSYRLSQLAAENRDCRAIAFCGVHFMAETADILANRPEKLAERGGERVPVILPDLAAGCSMADMAGIAQIEDAWDQLGEVIDTEDLTPVTYINSAASLKAFVGRHGGIVCTSSNAAGGDRVVVRAHQPGDVLSRSAPRPQHGPRHGHHARPDAGLGPVRRRARRQHRRAARAEQSHPLEGPLQRPPDVPAGARAAVPREAPGHQDPGPPRVPARSVRDGRRIRLDGQDHQDGRSRPRRARSGRSAPSCTW